jgi:hypothetical protein
MDLPFVRATLERAGVIFSAGMEERELLAVEKRYGFQFPDDLRRFLQDALPISPSWVNWREASEKEIQDRLDWPYEGICFDVECNGFWLEAWGPRPENLKSAFAIVKEQLLLAPKLIPICSHRYLPDRPNAEGNPVFSVHQTDIIYYGADLENYLENEFGYHFGTTYRIREPLRKIEFWSDLAD